MYDRDTVELALLTLGEGMSRAEAAEFCGASPSAVRAPPQGSHGGLLGWPLRTRRRSR